MSLFIGSLAFEQSGTEDIFLNDRLGILIGSTISAIAGYLYLNKVLPRGLSEDREEQPSFKFLQDKGDS